MTRTILASFVIMALLLVSMVAANTLDLSNVLVEVDNMDASSDSVAVEAGDTVPVDVYFTAEESGNEVLVSAWLQGYRSKGVEEDFADLVEGKEYHSELSLKVPTDIDPEEELTLYVRIESDAGNWEGDYALNLQRVPYNVDVLFVEVDSAVSAGESLPVDIVIKNRGRHELEDLVVSVSITELGVQKRAYFGDLVPIDSECDDDCDDEDALERRLYLSIPTNVESGVYELIVEAYNDDTDATVKKQVQIVGSETESDVIVPITSKELATGEEKTYEVIIVNSGDNIGVYEITTTASDGVMTSVDKSIVTVRAGTSEVILVSVKASEKGTYNVAVNINSKGELVESANLTAVVSEGKTSVVSGNVAVLTLILAIIFVVLLIVLIVLLTRKPRSEELEESYY